MKSHLVIFCLQTCVMGSKSAIVVIHWCAFYKGMRAPALAWPPNNVADDVCRKPENFPGMVAAGVLNA